MRFIKSGPLNAPRKIALEQSGTASPGLFWLGGFKSDMQGSKAQSLVQIAHDNELGVTRFDYSGHGQSGGNFEDGTISQWLEDAETVFGQTNNEQIVVGSSMGAWIALLLNQKYEKRIKALILIAPAVDMTQDLMLAKFSKDQHDALQSKGYVSQPSDYGSPYILTKNLLEDGAKHCLFGASIKTDCPVYVLQGGADKAVPPSHALKLVNHILLDPVFFTLVPDGDHSLSRPQDLALLKSSIERAMAPD